MAEWCVYVGLFFPFFICLLSSLFVPDFNKQKVSDLIAGSLAVDSDLYVCTSRRVARWPVIANSDALTR